jgi:hypothetical protein
MGSSLTKDIRPEALIVLDSIRVPIPYQIQGLRVTPGGNGVGGYAPPGVGSQVMGLAKRRTSAGVTNPMLVLGVYVLPSGGVKPTPGSQGGRLPGNVSLVPPGGGMGYLG